MQPFHFTNVESRYKKWHNSQTTKHNVMEVLLRKFIGAGLIYRLGNIYVSSKLINFADLTLSSWSLYVYALGACGGIKLLEIVEMEHRYSRL